MIIVILTMGIIAYIILSGFYLGTIENWDNFFPFGVSGVFRGSATIFFAYVGFDAVATAAEEAKNPKRVNKTSFLMKTFHFINICFVKQDLPIGILASLTISTILYVLVTAVLTLMVPYYLIDINSPLAAAYEHVCINFRVFVFT